MVMRGYRVMLGVWKPSVSLCEAFHQQFPEWNSSDGGDFTQTALPGHLILRNPHLRS